MNPHEFREGDAVFIFGETRGIHAYLASSARFTGQQLELAQYTTRGARLYRLGSTAGISESSEDALPRLVLAVFEAAVYAEVFLGLPGLIVKIK